MRRAFYKLTPWFSHVCLWGKNASGGLVKTAGGWDHSGPLLGRPFGRCQRLPGKEGDTEPADLPALPVIIVKVMPLSPEAESLRLGTCCPQVH